MKALAELRKQGKYIIVQVLGESRLVKHLTEIGMIPGRDLAGIRYFWDDDLFSGSAFGNQ